MTSGDLSRKQDFTSLDKYSAKPNEAMRLQEVLIRLKNLPLPNEEDWEAFQNRRPALGISHDDAKLVPFTILRQKMLEQFIECDFARSQEALLDYLNIERNFGLSKLPEWYDPSNSHKIGYQRCGCRTCFHSETLQIQFDPCPQCNKVFYCPRKRCRAKDWRLRHEAECEGLAKKRARAQLINEGKRNYESFLHQWRRAVFG